MPKTPDEAHPFSSQTRDELIKKEIAAEHAKVDAKTAKLRALRLAKEAADREAAAAQAELPRKNLRKPKKTGLTRRRPYD